MKTAVSIPDDLLEKAERLARRTNRSRSELFGAALREYLSRYAPDEITAAMDRVCTTRKRPADEFVVAASRRILERTQW